MIATPWLPISPLMMTLSPALILDAAISAPSWRTPTPEVLIKMPSALPLFTTLVSPATIRTSACFAAAAMDAMIFLRSASREPFFDDKAGGKKERFSSCDSEVVHRTAHSKVADIAAGKEERRHHVGIGGIGEPRRGHVHDSGIARAFNAESRAEVLTDQLVHHFAAAAVT